MKAFMQHSFAVDHIDLIVYVEAGQGKPVHRDRPSHGIVIQKDGNTSYSFENGKTFRLQKNEMIYLPKGACYRVLNDAPSAEGGCYAINFTLAGDFADEPFLFRPSNAQSCMEHFRSAERAWKIRRPGDGMKCMAELYAILSTMQAEYAAAYMPKSKTAVLRPALEYIDENYFRENISIPALAELCGISQPYFRRIFQVSMGTSPLKFIASRRIERACELLRFGEHSVRAVAELCGYGDECYFSREFKKATGVSPAVYQKQLGKRNP